MPKRKQLVSESSVAIAMVSYAKQHQVIPIENALLKIILSQGYEITRGTFEYWFRRLVEEGYLEIDETSRAIRIPALQIVEKSDRETSSLVVLSANKNLVTGREGYVYILKWEGHGYKIGRTVHLEERLRHLRRDFALSVEYEHIIKCRAI